MKINTSTQSFTSLNKAIKVTKLDDTNNSSSKKLDDAVSVNISSNATSNTSSLLNSLKEETVIQSMNGYVNPEGEIRKKILQEHYLNEVKINNQFENPYNHIWDKYENTSSPYYIQGLTKQERKIASQNEFDFQRLGKDNGYFNITDPLFRNSDDSSFYGDVDVARRKEFDRQAQCRK